MHNTSGEDRPDAARHAPARVDAGAGLPPGPGTGGRGGRRLLAAVAVGLLGAAFIWVVAPFNNFLLGLGYISDSYLPVAALFVMLVLVLAVSPALRRIRPSLALDRSQLAVVFGILLVASVLPGQGLLRQLPYAIAGAPVEVSQSRKLAEAYRKSGISPSLFPDRLEFGSDLPVVRHFSRELPPEEPIPWGAWARGPLRSWGPLLLACWMMMIGLAMVVLPQWRRNERLAFPLLTLQEALIEEPAPGRLWAPLFRNWVFWIAATAVFALHLLGGLSAANPEAVPSIPLRWNLHSLFREEPLRYLPTHVQEGRIYFLFVGTAFFMSSRVGFSVWFFVIAYAVYVVVGRMYNPGFTLATVRDHRIGAMFVLTGVILWLGRAHWRRVACCMFRRGTDPADRREAVAGWLLAAGCLGVFAWLVLVGNVQWWWALWYTGYGLMVSLLIARLVAETGMPFIRIDDGGSVPLVKIIGANLARAGGLKWLSAASLYMQSVIYLLVTFASRVSPSVMATHGLALAEDSGPRRQVRLAAVFLCVLVVGLVVCGAVHLGVAYRHSQTLQGTGQLINPGATAMLNTAGGDLLRRENGQVSVSNINSPARADRGLGHLAFGAALTGVLSWLCLRSPAWPLHPVGLLLVYTFFGNEAWVSVFIGWLAKSLVLRYGGARAYRLARPAFLGVIVGEVFAVAYWCIEPAVRYYILGTTYTPVLIQPL